MVTVPNPSTLVTVTRGGCGMWFQFNRQLIKGVGVPIARQLIVIVWPSVTETVSGGGETTVGGEQPIYLFNVIINFNIDSPLNNYLPHLSCPDNQTLHRTDSFEEYLLCNKNSN